MALDRNLPNGWRRILARRQPSSNNGSVRSVTRQKGSNPKSPIHYQSFRTAKFPSAFELSEPVALALESNLDVIVGCDFLQQVGRREQLSGEAVRKSKRLSREIRFSHQVDLAQQLVTVGE
jgi:hypothetical protein